MKNLIALTALTLISSQALAGRCVPDGRAFESRCDVQVTGTALSECHVTSNPRYDHPDYRGHYPGNYPGRYYPPYHTHPWERSETTKKASSCDVDLEDCKYFAFRELDKYSYRNQCGDLSVGKSVIYSYKTFNADGTVADEVTGRMRK